MRDFFVGNNKGMPDFADKQIAETCSQYDTYLRLMNTALG